MATASDLKSEAAVFVHGFGSTHDATWGVPGWPELMEDIGYRVVPFGLPGHGDSPVPGGTDDDTLDELLGVARREGAVSAVGFSAGSLLLLRAAVRDPGAFERLVLIGIGDGMWADPSGFSSLADTLTADEPDASTALLRQLAARAGNSIESIAAYARSAAPPPPLPSLQRVDTEVLVILGDEDTVGPADALVSALPRATLTSLPHTDHYRAPSSPEAMSAVLDFFAR